MLQIVGKTPVLVDISWLKRASVMKVLAKAHVQEAELPNV